MGEDQEDEVDDGEDEDDEEEEDDDDDEDEDEEDVEEDNQKRYYLRQRKATVYYQAPLESKTCLLKFFPGEYIVRLPLSLLPFLCHSYFSSFHFTEYSWLLFFVTYPKCARSYFFFFFYFFFFSLVCVYIYIFFKFYWSIVTLQCYVSPV